MTTYDTQRSHDAARRVHAFGDDALGTRDATAVAAAIDAGEITATEAVEAAIVRAEKVDPSLNALEFLDARRAHQRAGRVCRAVGTTMVAPDFAVCPARSRTTSWWPVSP